MALKVDPTLSIPTRASKSEEWLEWHKELVSNFGRKQANSLFIKAWKLRGNNSITTNEMRTYLTNQGINLTKSTLDIVVDKATSVENFFGDLFNMGKYAAIGVAVIMVGGLGLVVYGLAKNPAKSAGTIIKYAK